MNGKFLPWSSSSPSSIFIFIYLSNNRFIYPWILYRKSLERVNNWGWAEDALTLSSSLQIKWNSIRPPFLLQTFFWIGDRKTSYIPIEAIHKRRHPLRGGGGSAKRWCYSISLFSKMGDKGEGGVKNLKKMGDIIYRWPLNM